MSNVTNSEFQEWKRNPVTQAVMQEVQERIEDCKMRLCGIDNSPAHDQFLKGIVAALYVVLDTQPAIQVEDIENAV